MRINKHVWRAVHPTCANLGEVRVEVVEISAPGKGLPIAADHTGSPGNLLGLLFVHGRSLSNIVLPVVLIRLKQGSTGKNMKEADALLFSGRSPEY